MEKTHIEVTVPTSNGDQTQVCANRPLVPFLLPPQFFLPPNSLSLKKILWNKGSNKLQWANILSFFFFFFNNGKTEACRKNGRSDKNEEGQPFFTFTKLHYHHPCWLLQCIKKTVIHSFHWFLLIRSYLQIVDIYLCMYMYLHIFAYICIPNYYPILFVEIFH